MGDLIDQWEQKEKEEGIHCILCDKLCKNAYGLANHVTKTHGLPFPEYKRRVLEAAEKECFVIKQTADKARVLPTALDISNWNHKNLQHLFEMLKEEWK